MKISLLIVTMYLLISCSSQKNDKLVIMSEIGNFSSYKGIDTTETVYIDQYILDLDFDNKLDTVILENLKDLIGDPQIFTIVRVKLTSGKEVIIKNVGGYKQDQATKKSFPNRIKSDLIYIPTFIKDKNYLIIWDWQYPSCDALVSVYDVTKDEVGQAFKETFYVSEIDDFDGDDKLDFKGKSSCEQSTPDTIMTIE